MKKNLFLIKELIAHIKQTNDVQGCIKIPFPLKEIHKISCHPLKVRTVVGKRCIAYFGEVKFCVYVIHGEDLSIRFIEEKFHYKGFAFLEAQESSEYKPIIEARTEILNAFAEKDENEIKINGYILVELFLAKHREISFSELKCLTEEISSSEVHEKDSSPTFTVRSPEHTEFFPEMKSDTTLDILQDNNLQPFEEVLTEVYPGTNPEIILTLED